MTRDQAAEDLAYVRTVAEEGQQAPLIGGVYLVLFGVLLSVGYVLHWSLLSGVLQFGVGDPFLILCVGAGRGADAAPTHDEAARRILGGEPG